MVSTVASAVASSITYSPPQAVVQLGGYFFAFYRRASDGYWVYKSSSDGVTWGSETLASHTSNCPDTAFSAITDGTNVLIFYVVGTYALGDANATTAYTRIGTQSGGVISWASQVTVRNAAGWWFPSICKTTNRWCIGFCAYRTTSAAYHIHVYYSTDATSWTEILDSTTMVDLGYATSTALAWWPQYTDGLMLITAQWGDSFLSYKTYDGSSWAADSTFGQKVDNSYSTAAFDVATYNGEVHFIDRLTAGNNLKYYYFTTSWTGPITVVAAYTYLPCLSPYSANLYAFYRASGDVDFYWIKMDYSTHTWDGSPTAFALGETTPTYFTTDKYPAATGIAATWVAGSTPFDVRFEELSLAPPPTANIAPGALNPMLRAMDII